jgi:hypothetical protein
MEQALAHRPFRTRSSHANLAWAEHRGDDLADRLGYAAKRDGRNFKRGLVAQAEAIGGMAADRDRWLDVAGDVLIKGRMFGRAREVGRARAIEQLRRLFHPAVVETKAFGWLGDTVLITWLAPRDDGLVSGIDDPSFEQGGVAVLALSVATLGRRVLVTEFVQIEAPDHCLARLFQRSPRADGAAALYAAAASFMAMDIRQVAALRRETLHLPAGEGVFLSNVIWGRGKGGKWLVFARPRTFIASSMAASDQRALSVADDLGWSVLAAGWTLSGKIPGVGAPSVVATLEAMMETKP